MPRNTGGKSKKKVVKTDNHIKRPLEYKQEGQEYALAGKPLGSGRFLLTFDNRKEPRIGRVCGSMRKKVWITEGSLVLVSIRDFEDDKCDIIYKYNDDEAKQLKKEGQVYFEAKSVDDDGKILSGDDIDFVFDDI
jgi:translation initiation factor 1A